MTASMLGCVIFECLARRLQSIIDAYEGNPQKTNWQRANIYTGVRSAIDAIDPDLKGYAVKIERERRDRTTGTTWNERNTWIEEGVVDGGLPAGPGGGKANKKGKDDKGKGGKAIGGQHAWAPK